MFLDGVGEHEDAGLFILYLPGMEEAVGSQEREAVVLIDAGQQHWPVPGKETSCKKHQNRKPEGNGQKRSFPRSKHEALRQQSSTEPTVPAS